MARVSTKQMLKNIARKTGREAAANDDHAAETETTQGRLFEDPPLPLLSESDLVAFGRETARIEKNIHALSEKLSVFSRATKDIVKSLKEQQQVYLKCISNGTRDQHALAHVRDLLDRQNGKNRPAGISVREVMGGDFEVVFESSESDVGF